MGIRNVAKEQLQRLDSKTLDGQFREIVSQGLSCSPFEAQAVLKVVKDVYFSHLEPASPGKVTLVAVCADEPAGKPVARCQSRTISLTVHRGAVDDELLVRHGADAFRQARIPDLCQEALSQGALLTREDLAYRIFFVSTRTISRDLAFFRSQKPSVPIPLRSTLHDIGPTLTHRVQIVRLALQGKTTTQICNATRHSAQAVSNYLSTFTRCAQLASLNRPVSEIAFLLQRGPGLIQQYLDLLSQCKADSNMSYHLDQLLRLGQFPKKSSKSTKRRSSHG